MKEQVKKAKKTLGKRVDVNIPLPKNRFGKWLGKDVRWFPKYFSESYEELKRVVWPDRKTTWRYFFAVLVFSVVTAGIIVIADNIFETFIERVFL